MKSHAIPFLLSTIAFMIVSPAAAQAQHDLGKGNAFVEGTVLKLDQSDRFIIGGELVVKRSPVLRIHSLTGEVLHRSNGMIRLEGWAANPMWVAEDGQDPKRYRVTFITESDRAPDSRWQVSMHFTPLARHTKDLVVKLPNRVVSQYQQMCKSQGKNKKYQSEERGSVKGYSITSIAPYVRYEIEHSNGVDRGTMKVEEPNKARGAASTYMSQLRVAIRYECIIPGTRNDLVQETPEVTRTKLPKPTVKKPTIRKPLPIKAR